MQLSNIMIIKLNFCEKEHDLLLITDTKWNGD